jgi:hypothetical protein
MKTSRRTALGILILSVLPARSQVATVPSGFGDVPLPADMKIVPPGKDVPPAIAAFSGKWTGEWGAGPGPRAIFTTKHVLVVEELTATGATIIYAYGTYSPPGGGFPSGLYRGKATFEGNTLVYDTSGLTAKYTPNPDGTLSASWRGKRSGYMATATMTKAPT